MKIAVASDVHLEFGDLEIVNNQNAQVLILSGDILVARDITQQDPYGIMGPDYRSNRYHDFMQRCSAQFPHVIYIMGNHEHYNGDFATTEKHLKDVLGYLKNVHVLEKETVVIDDVTFIGGTLWTDMNSEDSLTLYHMSSMMNDFRIISNSNRNVNYRTFDDIDHPDKPTFRTRAARLSPEDTVEQHRQSVAYIQHCVEGRADQKFVVVGHHAPSRLSTHAQYANDTVMNGAYSSNLDAFIEDHPQIRLWTHGHTHHPFDYVIGETRVLCNPRGYINHEPAASDFKLLTVEV
jgi:predicted phosphodiesterase